MINAQNRLFQDTLPAKPYCTDDLAAGLVIRSVAHAIQKRYIQPNHPNSKLWLVYDIDRPTCPQELTQDLGALPPHFFVQNPENGHAHAFYGLETAVHLNPSSSRAAIRFAGALDVAMTQKLSADGSYCGLIAKNPLHDHWRIWQCATDQYQMNELAEYVDLSGLSDRRKSLPAVGLGRNCNLFDQTRKWAYRAIRQGWPSYEQWILAVEQRAAGYNVQFPTPLPPEEVRHLAKSIAKWTHANFSPEGFSAIQSARGKRGGRPSLGKPWIEQGISRATYFRKKQNETKAISDSSPQG